MSVAPQRRLQRAFGPVLFALCLLALLMPVSLAVHKSGPQFPTVNDQRSTADASQLSQGSPVRLSGIRDLTFFSDYTQDGNELLACDATLRYTLDGSNPVPANTASRTKAMPCKEAAVPLSSHSYEAILKPADLASAAANALLTFEIEGTTTVPQGTFTDNNANAFYKFRLDRSAAEITSKAPTAPPGSAVDAATQSDKPVINFVLEDNPLESTIRQDSLGIDVDGQNRTTQFDCSFPTPYRLQCAFNYAKAPAGFNFSVNQLHTVAVTGFDAVQNNFNNTKNMVKFRVDRIAPNVTEVTAAPQQSTPGGPGGLPITARNTNVTVKAKVTDPSVDTNSRSSIFAQLFNSSRSLVSPLQPMEFNASSGKWQTFNMTIPSTWPAQEFRVSARVLAVDLALNTGVGNTTAEAFILDPVAPTIVDVPAGAFQKDVVVKVKANIKDLGSGVDPATVILHYSNQTGKFKTAPPTAEKIDNTNYEAKMTRVGTTDNYTADIPAAENKAVITYFIKAKDKSGGQTTTPTRTYTIDLSGPNVTEPAPAAYRGKPPLRFAFDIKDAGAGVNVSTAKVFFGTGSTFASQVLNNTAGSTFVGYVNLTVTDGAKLKYYVEALDLLGNKGNLSSSDKPLTTTIDLAAPSFTITAPPTASTSTFEITWDGSDSGSGVASYTVQARVLTSSGTPSEWITIQNQTLAKRLDFCGEGDHTYQFRGFATDKVGNSGTPPATQQAQTVLSGAGCEEGVSARVTAPAAAEIINGATRSTYTVRYLASSTRSFTPAESIMVKLEFSPDHGVHWVNLGVRVRNTGTYELDLTKVPSCVQCQVRVTASTLSGASGTGSSGLFQIRGGSSTVDLDENGLPDSWELTYGSELGKTSPDGDEDKDGLTNAEEASAGSSPFSSDTDGDGVSDKLEVQSGTDPRSALSTPTRVQARSQQFTNWYWSVPALFGACCIVFFAGLARRW
jgi:hypothetical protein